MKIKKKEVFETNWWTFINSSPTPTEDLKKKISEEGFWLMHDVHLLCDDEIFSMLQNLIEWDDNLEYIDSATWEKISGYERSIDDLTRKIHQMNIPKHHKNYFLMKLEWKWSGVDYKYVIVSLVENKEFWKYSKHLKDEYRWFNISMRRETHQWFQSTVFMNFYMKK